MSTSLFARLMLCGLAGVMMVASGCRRDDLPPPKSMAQAELGAIPLRSTEVVVDKSIIAPAATAEEAAKPSGPSTPAAGSVPVDDSTAEALAQTYAAVISTMQLQQVPSLVIPDQRQKATELVQAMQPLLDATAELVKAAKEKFPDEKLQLTPANMPPPMTVAGVEPDANDPNAAMATFQTDGKAESKRILRKVDEHWKIDESSLSAPPDAQLPALVQSEAEATKSVMAKLQSGELADAAALKTEYDSAMKQAAGAAASGEPAKEKAEAAPAPNKPEANAKPSPKKEERSDVDGTFSGPNMLRGR